MKGKIARILTSYGFITPESSEDEEVKDIFFHKSGASQFYELEVGDAVEYNEGTGKKGDKIAVTVEKIEN